MMHGAKMKLLAAGAVFLVGFGAARASPAPSKDASAPSQDRAAVAEKSFQAAMARLQVAVEENKKLASQLRSRDEELAKARMELGQIKEGAAANRRAYETAQERLGALNQQMQEAQKRSREPLDLAGDDPKFLRKSYAAALERLQRVADENKRLTNQNEALNSARAAEAKEGKILLERAAADKVESMRKADEAHRREILALRSQAQQANEALALSKAGLRAATPKPREDAPPSSWRAWASKEIQNQFPGLMLTLFLALAWLFKALSKPKKAP